MLYEYHRPPWVVWRDPYREFLERRPWGGDQQRSEGFGEFEHIEPEDLAQENTNHESQTDPNHP